jgi:hypothetical protein
MGHLSLFGDWATEARGICAGGTESPGRQILIGGGTLFITMQVLDLEGKTKISNYSLNTSIWDRLHGSHRRTTAADLRHQIGRSQRTRARAQTIRTRGHDVADRTDQRDIGCNGCERSSSFTIFHAPKGASSLILCGVKERESEKNFCKSLQRYTKRENMGERPMP